MHKIEKQTQSGRSLVEMLGVLAVMGVLSVAGLYGYSLAMRKHRTNELFRELEFRANQVATKVLLGARPEDVSLPDEAFTSSGSFTFSAIKNTANNNQFKIVVKGKIEDKICSHMYSLLGSNSWILGSGQRNSNYTSSIDCVGQENIEQLVFVFNNDMSKEDGTGGM